MPLKSKSEPLRDNCQTCRQLLVCVACAFASAASCSAIGIHVSTSFSVTFAFIITHKTAAQIAVVASVTKSTLGSSDMSKCFEQRCLFFGMDQEMRVSMKQLVMANVRFWWQLTRTCTGMYPVDVSVPSVECQSHTDIRVFRRYLITHTWVHEAAGRLVSLGQDKKKVPVCPCSLINKGL
ncbi:hypothetical protein BC939DRAFT_460478 [Gamsiella multidivaricata]|uniref:uncharacterized protein n=1 Tax=Gamsiella multidivaricata TaxID=101098 RepID=UPI0022206EBC|nr:uncharacterized protein BC939DRAFT_460478 [Gamsiella multidivaricata]KAI7819345.1 hypothetical protein BC939DRAFT_460478 [Gamsiella multidivaricata]